MKKAVLVLNQNYEAISICSAKRAFLLVFLKKAELIDIVEGQYIRSSMAAYEMPSIIRLKYYVNIPYKKVSMTRSNIFKRDGYACIYCGTTKDLTIDHVLPRSRGGKDTWENLVTACHSCNSKKGNRTPEEADMPLLRKPFKPTHLYFLKIFEAEIRDSWKPYLFVV